MSDRAEFSVYQFFKDDIQDCEVRFVDMERAVNAFARLTQNVAARIGITKRVIITDGGDHTIMEWKYGEGVTYPPELVNIDLSRRKPTNG